jgi:CRP-like cAMP-binding protein
MLQPELSHFLSQYAHIPEQVLLEFTASFKEKKIAKNSFLLKEGHVCRHFGFVKSGCLRLYYTGEKQEVSVWFAFSNNSAIEISSYLSNAPSAYAIQAIEDSTVLYLPKEELETLCAKHPALQEMMRRYWEVAVLSLITRFTSLQKDSAEKRYKDLLHQTEYLQKIPQKYLASFIGVTPTSLSRIRRKVK